MSRDSVFYKDWCLEVLNFLSTTFRDYEAFYNQKKIVVNKVFDLNSIKALKLAYQDINADAKRELSPVNLLELNTLLKSKFNEALVDEVKLLKKMKK